MHDLLVCKERDELGVTVSGTNQLMQKVFLSPESIIEYMWSEVYDQSIQHTVSNVASGMAHSHSCKVRRQ